MNVSQASSVQTTGKTKRNLKLMLTALPVLATLMAYGSQANAQATNCSCGCAAYQNYPASIVGGNSGDVVAYSVDGFLAADVIAAGGMSYRHVAIQYDSAGQYVSQSTWNGGAPNTVNNCADPMQFTGVNSLQALLPGVQNYVTPQGGSGLRLPSAGYASCYMPYEYYEIAAFGTPGAWDCATTLQSFCGVGSYNPQGSHYPSDGLTPSSRFYGNGYAYDPYYGQWSSEYTDWVPSLSGAPYCPVQGGCGFSNPHQLSGDQTYPAAVVMYNEIYNQCLAAGQAWYVSLVCGGVSHAGMCNRVANQMINESLYTTGNQNYDYNSWGVGGDPSSTPDWVVDYAEYFGHGATGLSVNPGGYECSQCTTCSGGGAPVFSAVYDDNEGNYNTALPNGYVTVYGSGLGSTIYAYLNGYQTLSYVSATQVNVQITTDPGDGTNQYFYLYSTENNQWTMWPTPLYVY